ncbi:ATP-dependent helicase, putative [Eimeria necatrix]|uniref:ATP-dependent helicase, putative n=1 Tax=Eimeria necatrix TaxID=51315 RepID=U6MZ48_9EIME|nr:ATP-dependent helicase, putative [Eimeria necatrix]CDJ69231.1 ATP-dependent helicase, putative [Eimeria necatrix]
MAKPVARWRRSGPRDSIGIQRGAEASAPPGSSTPSDNQEPNIPRTFSSFRTQGIASTTQEPGTSPSREDGLLRAPSGFGPAGFSTQSPSVGGSGGLPAHNIGASDGSRGNFGPPVSHAPTGSDPQSAISVLFGNRGLEAFNKLTLDDEYILHFYGVRQTFMKPAVQEHCERAPGGDSNGGFQHTLVWNVRSREFRASGIGRSKKDAKKEAVKVLLVQLGPVTPHEYEQVTRVIFSTLRGKLNAKQRAIPISRMKHSFEWNFLLDGEPTIVESQGSGSFPAEAEIAAMQDMYIKVQELKDKGLMRRAVLNAEASKNRKVQPQEHRSQITRPSQLSKHTAGEINMLHNTVTSQNQIKATETITEAPEGHRCALEWKWKSNDGRMHSHVIVAVGSTKAGARAQAAMQMMQAAGFIEHVDDKDRQAALMVVNQVESKKDPSVYVESACRLIAETRGAVWRIFLPVVWRAAMAEGSRSLVNSLIDQLKVQAAPRPVVAEQTQSDGQSSSGPQEVVKASYDAPKVMPPDLWEQLLDECTVLTNCEFGQSVLHELGGLSLDSSWFPSTLAMRYFHNYRLMLALEWQAQVATNISDQEERMFLRSVQFREDDIVLLRPADPHAFTEEESWQRCFVGVVTSVKGDFSESMNVNVRVATAEVKKYPEVFTTNKFKLYYLTPAVTHDRMVQALRGLTMSKHPAGKSPPPYVFAPEIRYLLLHTSEPQAQQVSGRGPVPQLSDTDPEQYNPLHQLDELADGDSCKKQRVQPSLLQQVSLQARRQTPSSSRSAADEGYEMFGDGFRLPTGLPLNEAQRQATISAMTNRLTLVQGPPGTGKTHVACAIIDAWQRINPTKKILAVADSNVAADNLMEGLSNRGIRSVRVGSGSESDLKEESIQDLPRYRDLLRMRDKNSGEARSLRMLLVREAVRKYNVIIATCVGSGHEMFDDVTFERVIIDECAQSIEPSNLIPLGHGCRSVVLIGDHKQLPPTIVSREASDGGLGVSLLERFVGSGIAPIHLLNEQRRMHPSIAHFPNMQFYQGKIFSRDVDDCNRPPVAGFLWPSSHSRVCLIDISAGLANMEQSLGTSKYSLVEIDPILAILRSVLQCGTIRPSEIGILTPYDAQKARIRFALNDSFDKALCYQIDVDSVDGFQGKEKDLIIFSAVRSNPRGEIGFLKDARRLNVMLTRARRGLLVVGDQLSLWADTVNWRPWISWVGSQRSIVPISRLNDYLEVPTYNYNPIASGAARVGASAVGTGSVTATSTGGGAIKTAYMPQGFQADFGSGGMGVRGEGGRETAPEPMHEEEEVPEDWEQHL